MTLDLKKLSFCTYKRSIFAEMTMFSGQGTIPDISVNFMLDQFDNHDFFISWNNNFFSCFSFMTIIITITRLCNI